MFVDNLTNIPDDQFIIPMRLDPDFKDRLLIRRVQVDANNPYIGRDGQKHDHPYLDLANKLAVRGVLYVLFVAPDGSRITAIQGTAIDYYDYYLNKDINLATDCAKNPGQKFCNGNADGPGLQDRPGRCGRSQCDYRNAGFSYGDENRRPFAPSSASGRAVSVEDRGG